MLVRLIVLCGPFILACKCFPLNPGHPEYGTPELVPGHGQTVQAGGQYHATGHQANWPVHEAYPAAWDPATVSVSHPYFHNQGAPLEPGVIVPGAKPSPGRHGAKMRRPHLATEYEPGTVPGEMEPAEPMPMNAQSPKSSGQANSVPAGTYGQEYTASGQTTGPWVGAGALTEAGTGARFGVPQYPYTASGTGGYLDANPQYPYTARGRGGYLDAIPQYPYTTGGSQAHYNPTADFSTNKFGAVPSNKHAGASQTSQQGQNAKPTGTTIPPGVNPADYEPPEPLEPGEVPPGGAAPRDKKVGATPRTAATAFTGYTALTQGFTNLHNGHPTVTSTRIDAPTAYYSTNNVGVIAGARQQGQKAKLTGTTIPPGVDPADYEPPEPLEPGELPPAGTAKTGVTGKRKTPQTVYGQSTTQTPSSGPSALTVKVAKGARAASLMQNKPSYTEGTQAHYGLSYGPVTDIGPQSTGTALWRQGKYRTPSASVMHAGTQTTTSSAGTWGQNKSTRRGFRKGKGLSLDTSPQSQYTSGGTQAHYELSYGPVVDVGTQATGTTVGTQGKYRTSSASVMDTGAQTTTSVARTSVHNKATSGRFGHGKGLFFYASPKSPYTTGRTQVHHGLSYGPVPDIGSQSTGTALWTQGKYRTPSASVMHAGTQTTTSSAGTWGQDKSNRRGFRKGKGLSLDTSPQSQYTSGGTQAHYELSYGPVVDVGTQATGTTVGTQGKYRTSSASVMDTGAQTTTSVARTSVHNKATSGRFGHGKGLFFYASPKSPYTTGRTQVHHGLSYGPVPDIGSQSTGTALWTHGKYRTPSASVMDTGVQTTTSVARTSVHNKATSGRFGHGKGLFFYASPKSPYTTGRTQVHHGLSNGPVVDVGIQITGTNVGTQEKYRTSSTSVMDTGAQTTTSVAITSVHNKGTSEVLGQGKGINVDASAQSTKAAGGTQAHNYHLVESSAKAVTDVSAAAVGGTQSHYGLSSGPVADTGVHNKATSGGLGDGKGLVLDASPKSPYTTGRTQVHHGLSPGPVVDVGTQQGTTVGTQGKYRTSTGSVTDTGAHTTTHAVKTWVQNKATGQSINTADRLIQQLDNGISLSEKARETGKRTMAADVSSLKTTKNVSQTQTNTVSHSQSGIACKTGKNTEAATYVSTSSKKHVSNAQTNKV